MIPLSIIIILVALLGLGWAFRHVVAAAAMPSADGTDPNQRHGATLILLRLIFSPIIFLTALTRTGYVYVALAALTAFIAFYSDMNQLPFLVTMMLISLLALSTVVSGLSMRGVVIRRGVPSRVWAGQEFQVELTVQDQNWMVPCGGLHILDTMPNAPGGPTEACFVSIVPPRHAAKVQYPMRVRRRGYYEFGPTRLASTFPMGLITNRALCHIESDLLVYPRLGAIGDELLRDAERYFEHIRRMRPVMIEEDFRGLRDYRHGDNPKWIHWKSSARRNQLVVREFEKPEKRQVTILLDTYYPERGRRKRIRLESAISFCASAAREFSVRGYEVLFATFGPDPVLVEVSEARRNLDELYETLARLDVNRDAPLEDLHRHLPPQALSQSYVLAVVPGLLPNQEDPTQRLRTVDNHVRVVNSDESAFRQIFARSRKRLKKVEPPTDTEFNESAEAEVVGASS